MRENHYWVKGVFRGGGTYVHIDDPSPVLRCKTFLLFLSSFSFKINRSIYWSCVNGEATKKRLQEEGVYPLICFSLKK